MNFLERAAMKVLERGLRSNKNPIHVRARRPPEMNEGEIVPYAPAELERMEAELLYYRRLAAQREAELLELQRIDTLGSIEERHREKQIRSYLAQIERLNLTTPGGLRSQPVAEPGEDQELVNAAWLIFCQQRRGGSSRLG